MSLSENVRAQIDHWLTKYPKDRKQSALLPALMIVQESNQGWLSIELMNAVADYLEIPQVAAYEVATFYSMYNLSPVGKHTINVCTNISCLLAGCEKIVKHLKERLGIPLGETTPDRRFTLRQVECLGACANAPVVQIDKQYYENITPERLDEWLVKAESED